MPARGARGRKRKNVSSSEEEEEESEESSLESEESEEEEEEEESEEEVKPARRRKQVAKKAPASRKAAAKAPPKKRGRAAKKVVEEDEDEAEEELGGAPPSAAVAQSIEEEEANDPGFGPNLLKDEADRIYLQSLPEVEREKVFSERFDRLQRYEEWKRLRAERAGATSQAPSSSRRAAPQTKNVPMIDSDEEDDKKRKPSQAPSASASAKREADNVEDETDEDEVSSEGDVIPRKRRGDESDDDMEDHDDEELDFASTSRITLTRKQILEWMDYPRSRFLAGITGCFVKVLLDDKVEKYGLRQITKVKEGVDPYVVDREGVFFMLKLKGGPKNKTVLFSLGKVSNKPVTEADFAIFSKERTFTDLQRKDARYVWKNLRENLSQYVLTAKDVLRMVASRKARHGDNSVLVRSVGLTTVSKKRAIMEEVDECNRHRGRLAKALEQIEAKTKDADDEYDNEDDEEDEREKRRKAIVDELRDVNDKLTRLESELKKVEAHIARDSERRLANEISLKLNERNELRNRTTIVEVEQRKRKEHGAAGGGANTAAPSNPFLRRPTRPQMMWDTSLSTKDATGNDKIDKSANGASGTTTTTTTTSTSNGTENAPNNKPSEASAAHKEDAPIASEAASEVKPQQVKLKVMADAPIVVSTATKKFSLEEYRKMKQAGAIGK